MIRGLGRPCASERAAKHPQEQGDLGSRGVCGLTPENHSEF